MSSEKDQQAKQISIGQMLGHYRILAKIGQGGMGEVYKAEDTSLKRQIALKVLPPEVSGDAHRLERFQREAEAIAALNHPNIVTIYSVEQDLGIRFLTMELVDGKSLDTELARGRLSLTEVADIGAALADALAAAHEKGIVHRDLKPANVMLTGSSSIKVLDFGLAKVAVVTDEADATQMATLTQEGVVVGTAAYMSPEQAQGKPVDSRSDIFSLGCLLFEAATGMRPFKGETSIDLLHNLIHKDPESLSDHLPEAPLQLQWIFRKTLAKNPQERYQSAADLTVDLKTLRRDLETDPHLVTVDPAAAPSVQPVKRESRLGPVVAVAIALAVLAMAVTIWLSTRPGEQRAASPPPAKPLSINKLTSQGNVIAATISPDGNFFAYVETHESGHQSLNLQQITSGQDLELVPFRPVGTWGLTFFPDGSEILFALKSAENPAGTFHRISTLGGISQQFGGEGVDSLVDISPDGSQIAWYRAQYPSPHQSSLMVAHADGAEERTVVSADQPDRFAPMFYTGPSWSPDGKLIATTVHSSKGERRSRIEVYQANTGEMEWSVNPQWSLVTKVTWLPAGDGLLVIAEEEYQENHQIWQVSYPQGIARQITNDFLIYRMISLSEDGRRLVTVGANSTDSMWTTSREGRGDPRRISTGNKDGHYGFAITPDGRIVYTTHRSGYIHLAIMNIDGSNSMSLTTGDTHNIWPQTTPDGQIVYVARATQSLELRRMNLDGSHQTVLTTAKAGMQPKVSPDGKWVVYHNRAFGPADLWRVPVEGGTPEQLTTYESQRAAISPDSSRIAFYFRSSIDSNWQIAIAPITGGEPEQVFDEPHFFFFSRSFIRWSDDGKALLINSMADDRANLWRLPLAGGEPERLTDFQEPRLSWVEFHPDGETMVFSRSHWSRDAILIENFR